MKKTLTAFLFIFLLIPATGYSCGNGKVADVKGGCDDEFLKPLTPEEQKKQDEMMANLRKKVQQEREEYIAYLQKTSPEKLQCPKGKWDEMDSFEVKDRKTVEWNLNRTAKGNKLVFWTEFDKATNTHKLIDAKCY